jgi:hypothetical protein
MNTWFTKSKLKATSPYELNWRAKSVSLIVLSTNYVYLSHKEATKKRQNKFKEFGSLAQKSQTCAELGITGQLRGMYDQIPLHRDFLL